jgi:hypothetical protein
VQNLTELLEKAETQKVMEMEERIKAQEAVRHDNQNHEEEVNLRLKFEDKLNNLHAINRLQFKELNLGK